MRRSETWQFIKGSLNFAALAYAKLLSIAADSRAAATADLAAVIVGSIIYTSFH